MRFFYRVRTNEITSEVTEVPDIPLRRSPSVAAERTADGTTEITDITTVVTSTTPVTPAVTPVTSVPSPSIPKLVITNELFIKPEPPRTKNNETSETDLINIKVKSSEPKKSIDSKSTKVKTPKTSEEKLVVKQQKLAKKLKEDIPEKRVENIKLKIEQNSVTIIKSSTKELKLKFKKERELKESSKLLGKKRSSDEHSSKKKGGDIASIKIAKIPETPNTKNGQVKYEIKSPVDKRSPLRIEIEPIPIKKEIDEIDEQKSEFLNSFNLTPTKSLSPEKLQLIDAQKKLNQLSPKVYMDIKMSKSPKSPDKLPSPKLNKKSIDIKIGTSPEQKLAAEQKVAEPKLSSEEKPKPVLNGVSASSEQISVIPIVETLSLNKDQKQEEEKQTEEKVLNGLPSAASKRKNKEPVKNVTKKCRSNSPPTVLAKRPEITLEICKKSITPPLDKKLYNGMSVSAIPTINDFATLPPPPPPLKRIEIEQPKISPTPVTTQTNAVVTNQAIVPFKPDTPSIKEMVWKSQNQTIKKPDTPKQEKKNLSVKSMDKLIAKPLIVNNIQRPNQSDTPRPSSSKGRSQQSVPKKLPTILPKPSPPIAPKPIMPKPFLQPIIPIATILRNSDTEIKQIKNDGSNKDIKVYGPAMEKPTNKTSNGSASPAYIPSFSNGPIKANNGYLNYALMNSHKRSNEQPPLGMRSPASYVGTQNSPSYSPNSPQYSPSYNIPTYPQYKYMKSPAHVANYFQGPVPKPASQVKSETNDSKRKPEQLKRAHATTETADTPPEKQKKVQSLLDSCKISFPSSLSITLHEQNDPASINPLFNPMRKSPVNNYIEIVKLPDVSVVPDDKKSSPPPPARKEMEIISKSKEMEIINSKCDAPKRSPNEKIDVKPKTPERKIAPMPDKTKQIQMDKASFQEKFLQSIRDKESRAKVDAKLEKEKSKCNQDGWVALIRDKEARAKVDAKLEKEKSKSKPDGWVTLRSLAPNDGSKPKASTPPLHYRRLSVQSKSESSNSTLRSLLKHTDGKSPVSLPSASPPAIVTSTTTTPTGSPGATNKIQQRKKSDAALDLTSSVAAVNRMSSSPNNNNDNKKPSMEQPDNMASYYAAAMAARASHNPGFMIPSLPGLPFPNIQHVQQTYILEHFARMQKAGHEKLNEVLESFKHNLKSNKKHGNSS